MTGPWLRVDLSKQQVEEGAVDRIREECFRWYLAARTPAGAQLFSKPPPAHRSKNMAMELHFSPVMALICRDAIAAYHPVVANNSRIGDATLLVGENSGSVGPLSPDKPGSEAE